MSTTTYRPEAAFAEETLSPAFRDALNKESDKDLEAYTQKKEAAEALILGAIPVALGRRAVNRRALGWHMRRELALSKADGDVQDIGEFGQYVDSLDPHAEFNVPDDYILTPGGPEVVRTNYMVVASKDIESDPLDYFETALDTIAQRKNESPNNINPENYATALKLFTDKFRESGVTRIDREDTKDLVDNCLNGYLDVAEREEPNPIGMTNIYASIRRLEQGVVDKKFTMPLLTLTLEHIPQFHNGTKIVALGGIGKLDLSDSGEVGADCIDLIMRSGLQLEKTSDLRVVARAIANLPATLAANETFKTFLAVRNGLEQPLDLEGLDELNQHLRRIVEHVVDDPELTKQAIEVAHTNVLSAVEIMKARSNDDSLTKQQLQDLRTVVQRIADNWRSL